MSKAKIGTGKSHFTPPLTGPKLGLNYKIKLHFNNTARFLKYVWPFFNIMDERVKTKITKEKTARTLLK